MEGSSAKEEKCIWRERRRTPEKDVKEAEEEHECEPTTTTTTTVWGSGLSRAN